MRLQRLLKRMCIWPMLLTASVAYANGDICQISGVSGTCGIAPFVGPDSENDKEQYTCAKLRGSQYFHGQCVNGRLHGLIALTQARSGRQSLQLLLQVSAGTPQEAGLVYYDWGIAARGFVNGREESSSGCINWNGGWDNRLAWPNCVKAGKLFGSASLEQPFAQQMLNRKIDLSALAMGVSGGSGVAPVSPHDDPKARGRSARVM